MNAVYTQIWIAICDYLLLIIAKKRYMLQPSLHSFSNSIGQVLFKRGDIRDIFNQTDFILNVPEGEVDQRLRYGEISPDSNECINKNLSIFFEFTKGGWTDFPFMMSYYLLEEFCFFPYNLR